MSFVLCVQHDYESSIICTVFTIYSCVLCKDGVIIHMCHCMLLASLGMLPCWVFFNFCGLCMCYMYMWIEPACISIWVFMHGMVISLHSSSYNIETKRTPFSDMCNTWHSNDLLHLDVLSYMK